ncbi:MAG: hypothetical protein O2794_01305 [bacterium]|nr:hypothetical protein [bacterium]
MEEVSPTLSTADAIAREIDELLPDALAEALGEAVVALDNDPYPEGCFNFLNCCMAVRVSEDIPMEDEPGETKDIDWLVLYEHTHEHGVVIVGVVPDKLYLVQ